MTLLLSSHRHQRPSKLSVVSLICLFLSLLMTLVVVFLPEEKLTSWVPFIGGVFSWVGTLIALISVIRKQGWLSWVAMAVNGSWLLFLLV